MASMALTSCGMETTVRPADEPQPHAGFGLDRLESVSFALARIQRESAIGTSPRLGSRWDAPQVRVGPRCELLREAEFNQISISPNGKLLAIARTTGKVASVTLHKREDLAPIITFDPGANGAITDLSWVDASRLIIGATRIDPVDGYAAIEPIPTTSWMRAWT